MTTTSGIDLGRARFAVSAVFLLNGFVFATWVSRIPSVADKLSLSSGEVGTALMALAAGAIVAFPLAGRLIDSRGSAVAMQVTGFSYLVVFPFVAIAPRLLILIPILFFFGAGNGSLDVSMNAQGSEAERASGRSIMTSLHGFFSVGALAGAGAGALAAQVGLPVLAHFLIVSLLGIATLARTRRWLIPSAPKVHAETSPVFVLPARALLPLGALACCASVGEGAMGDWSGLYLHDYLGTEKGYAALGYAAFSVAMVLGRFFGDRVVERIGAARMVRIGGLIAAAGLGIATLINDPPAMLFGFAAIGLGLSSIYPLVFSAAGNHPSLPSGQAVAGTATIGYTGFLAGPPVLGWIAQFTSLRAIMAAIVLLAALAALLASAVRPAATKHAPGERDEPAAGFEMIG